MSQLDILFEFVYAFDIAAGLPPSVFNATKQLSMSILGQDAADIFSRYIDATDDSFYFADYVAFQECWQEMIQASRLV